MEWFSPGADQHIKNIESVVERVKSGDQQAYATIIHTFEKQIYRYCYYILKNREEAEDAVQDIFIKVYQAMGKYHQQVSFSAWFYKVAYYHCLDQIRKKSHWRQMISIQKEQQQHFNDYHPSGDEREVEELLMNLNSEERNLVLLKAVEQYSFEEIGQIMDCKPATLGSRFVSPAMAETLKNIPLIGSVFQYTYDNGLRTAGKSGLTTTLPLSETQDGVTLHIKEVMFDGLRLVLMIERTGIEKIEMIAPIGPPKEAVLFDTSENKAWKETVLKKPEKGYLSTPDVIIQGEEIKGEQLLVLPRYGGVDQGKVGQGKQLRGTFTVANGEKEFTDNMVVYEISRGLAEKQLPDEFNITVKLNVSGIRAPFVFQVPVQNVFKHKILLKPEKTQRSGSFSYTVKQIELTPLTTRLIIDSKGKVTSTPEKSGDFSPSRMYYDIVDQRGHTLNLNQTSFLDQFLSGLDFRFRNLNGWRGIKSEYLNEELLYDPVVSTSPFIIIKSYTYTLQKKDRPIVEGQEGGMKTYYKDLEMTIPLEANP
ncbi:sigma-70 family RNA polymerase sigma factor [Paenibacillus sp. 8b26]|uniref:sigma-70 family RNA polymerase sigma factor n=1 Tax=Paenibacillus sp. 8b26 TaxID=3424133 RepID=UPI003D64A293